MNKIFILSCIFLTTWLEAVDTASDFFDTSFLKKYNLVRQRLIHSENFEQVSFTTQDGYTLHGLARFVDVPECTLIFINGFFPGKCEGLASYIKLVPENYNILFYDARHRGQSRNIYSLLNIWQYGLLEYKDVLASLDYMHSRSKVPIIIHGTCAGAFHAARALIYLTKTDPCAIKKLALKGLIYDSGWAHMSAVAPQAFQELIKSSSLLTILSKPFMQLMTLHKSFTLSVQNVMHSIPIPLFFVHSTNDTIAPFLDLVDLAQEVHDKHYWWIPVSKHACHHLKYAQEYADKLQKFCCYALRK